MSAWKIDSDVPIPTKPQSPAKEAEESSGFEAYQARRYRGPHQKCANDQHSPAVGKCDRCGDIFPCPGGKCNHLDCAQPQVFGLDAVGNGKPFPEWFNIVEPSEPLARQDYSIALKPEFTDE